MVFKISSAFKYNFQNRAIVDNMEKVGSNSVFVAEYMQHPYYTSVSFEFTGERKDGVDVYILELIRNTP